MQSQAKGIQPHLQHHPRRIGQTAFRAIGLLKLTHIQRFHHPMHVRAQRAFVQHFRHTRWKQKHWFRVVMMETRHDLFSLTSFPKTSTCYDTDSFGTNSMRLSKASLIVVTLLTLASTGCRTKPDLSRAPATIFLVRHAEKVPD